VTALKHLVREWLCENPTQLIMGFAGRKEAEVLLKEKPIGKEGGREGGREGRWLYGDAYAISHGLCWPEEGRGVVQGEAYK